MKKNKMMRIASILMVATLITTCAISGTFAKYVTKVEGTDTARVAKWGVLLTVSAEGTFKTEYATDENEDNLPDPYATPYAGEVSVKSSTKDKVVAPGTGMDEEEALIATVTGTPEVATRYTLKISGLKDIFLPAGTYTDYTELVLTPATETTAASYGYTKTFTTDDYSPIKWNLKVSNSNNVSYDLVGVAKELGYGDFAGFSFTDAKAIVESTNAMNALLPELMKMVGGASNAQVNFDGEDIYISMDFDPNTEMDYTFELTWAWDFDDEGKGTYDKQDTLLGNLIAAELDKINLPVAEGATTPEANLWIEAVLTATATQID